MRRYVYLIERFQPVGAARLYLRPEGWTKEIPWTSDPREAMQFASRDAAEGTMWQQFIGLAETEGVTVAEMGLDG